MQNKRCATCKQFCGYVGSVWVIGEWASGFWIVDVTNFQKIYGLYSVEHHKVEKWPYKVGGFCGYGGSVWVMGEWAVGY